MPSQNALPKNKREYCRTRFLWPCTKSFRQLSQRGESKTRMEFITLCAFWVSRFGFKLGTLNLGLETVRRVEVGNRRRVAVPQSVLKTRFPSCRLCFANDHVFLRRSRKLSDGRSE